MVATMLLGISAVNTGNNLLFLTASAMLSFMAVSGLLGWLNLRHLKLELAVPDEVYAARETLVTLRLVNRKRMFPSFLIEVSVASGATAFILLPRACSEEGTFLATFPTRGWHQISAAVISSPFPVNFFRRYRRIPLSVRVQVFPAPRPLNELPAAAAQARAALYPSSRPGHEGDLAKINDYRGGEALKLIHWRLSAKHEVFKVKELTAAADEPVLLEVELLPGKDLEERLSLCCFLVNRLQKLGRAVGLKMGERIIEPACGRGHRLRLLGELARYGTD